MSNYYKDVLDVVAKYEGYIEKASNNNLDSKTANRGTNNYTRFSRDVNALGLMGCQGQPWCATYQFACEVEAYGLEQALKNWCMTKNSYVGYNCFAIREKFRAKNKYKRTPKLGSLVIFTFSHIGRIIEISGNRIGVNEGNTSANTYDRNGGMVKVKYYDINDPKIDGFCIIDYETEKEKWVATGTAVCNADDVNLRQSPNGAVLGVLNKGNRFEINGEVDGNWTKAKVDGIGVGYVYSKYVDIDTPVKTEPEDVNSVPVETPEMPFDDVEKSDYFYDAVVWAVNNTFACGMTDDTFEPDTPCTREQAISFLWRIKGAPIVECNIDHFKDVRKGAYYYDAIAWAYKNGIVVGFSKDEFGIGKNMTRGQLMTVLWRMCNSPTVNEIATFMDVDANSYCYNAVLWAKKNDIALGYSDTLFGVDDDCTRGQVIAFLHRASKII